MAVAGRPYPLSSDTEEISPSLVLASASPRRQELLTQIGVQFEVRVPDIDEQRRPGEMPEPYVCRLAEEKSRAGMALAPRSALPVLGADTIVVCEGQILGKPTNRDDAIAMLELLSGREHTVLTAVCLSSSTRSELLLAPSRVRFRTLHTDDLLAYWDSGEPIGKAGAYAIQGLAAMFVEHLKGSYSGVMGLPLYETAQLLRQFDVATGLHRRAGAPVVDSGAPFVDSGAPLDDSGAPFIDRGAHS